MSDRRSLRKALRAARKKLSAQERAAASRRIASLIARSHWLVPGRRIALFLSMAEEIDTAPLIETARRRGCDLYFPRIENIRQRRMVFTPPGPGRRFNRLGIAEFSSAARISPAALQIVFLPLVGFDAQGNRLGMGAGYYDRALAFRLRRQRWAGPRLIGLAYSCQQTELIEPSRTDVPLDAVVTERGIRIFRGENR